MSTISWAMMPEASSALRSRTLLLFMFGSMAIGRIAALSAVEPAWAAICRSDMPVSPASMPDMRTIKFSSTTSSSVLPSSSLLRTSSSSGFTSMSLYFLYSCPTKEASDDNHSARLVPSDFLPARLREARLSSSTNTITSRDSSDMKVRNSTTGSIMLLYC